MLKITQEDLYSKYPSLLNKHSSIECNDGWLQLIDTLCLIANIYITYSVPDKLKSAIYIVQIKEKFGLLRVYFNQSNDYINGAIAMVESMSSHICEVCGAPGVARSGKHIKTLCSSHALFK